MLYHHDDIAHALQNNPQGFEAGFTIVLRPMNSPWRAIRRTTSYSGGGWVGTGFLAKRTELTASALCRSGLVR